MVNQLKVEKRDVVTQSQLKELRFSGKIPAVVYGENIRNTSIAVEEKQLIALLRSNPNAVVQMDLPDQGKHQVIVSDLQRDPLYRNILHIDFKQINVKNPIKASVRIEFTGKAEGVKDGGILQTAMNELDIQCLPNLIPSHISVDVSQLNIGDAILVSDIKVANEIEILSDSENVVASVLSPQKPTEEEVEEEAEEKAEVEEESTPEETKE